MSAIKYLELLPAVDVKDGRAVRLVQGELARESVYGQPLEVALEFQAAGAEWLHLVDLDAAFGRGDNSAILAEVIGRLDIKVELSGGIRDDESLKRALATGCRRINLGTAALENPEWTARVIAEHGDRIAVGLDVRGHVLAARPNLELLREVCSATKKPVVASGGISSLADISAISALNEMGVEGAIIGKALYAGAFTLQEALALTKGAK